MTTIGLGKGTGVVAVKRSVLYGVVAATNHAYDVVSV